MTINRFLILTTMFASFIANGEPVISEYCSETVIQSNRLKAGQMVRVQQGELRVNVYRRSDEEMARAIKHAGSNYDEKYPAWWPKDKYPLKFVSKVERSIVPKYFVFYDRSPINGAIVTLINPNWYDESEDLSYLGTEWVPGLIDYDNQVYYDTTGRPVKWGQKSEEVELSKVPLLVPRHEYDKKSGSIRLLCQ
ncbi:TPA: hypothetical protein ACVOYK_004473 [Vibrio diabolicus]